MNAIDQLLYVALIVITGAACIGYTLHLFKARRQRIAEALENARRAQVHAARYGTKPMPPPMRTKSGEPVRYPRVTHTGSRYTSERDGDRRAVDSYPYALHTSASRQPDDPGCAVADTGGYSGGDSGGSCD